MRQGAHALGTREGKKRARIGRIRIRGAFAIGVAHKEEACLGKTCHKPQSLWGHRVGVVDKDVGYGPPALPCCNKPGASLSNKGLRQHGIACSKGIEQGFQAGVLLLPVKGSVIPACPHGHRLGLGACDILGRETCRTQVGKEKRALRGTEHAWGTRELVGKPAPGDNAGRAVLAKVSGKAYCQPKGPIGIRRHHKHVCRHGTGVQHVMHTRDKCPRLARAGTARQDLDLGGAHG